VRHPLSERVLLCATVMTPSECRYPRVKVQSIPSARCGGNRAGWARVDAGRRARPGARPLPPCPEVPGPMYGRFLPGRRPAGRASGRTADDPRIPPRAARGRPGAEPWALRSPRSPFAASGTTNGKSPPHPPDADRSAATPMCRSSGARTDPVKRMPTRREAPAAATTRTSACPPAAG
jgi:hypothetical protein